MITIVTAKANATSHKNSTLLVQNFAIGIVSSSSVKVADLSHACVEIIAGEIIRTYARTRARVLHSLGSPTKN